jgi:hypothetical protein
VNGDVGDAQRHAEHEERFTAREGRLGAYQRRSHIDEKRYAADEGTMIEKQGRAKEAKQTRGADNGTLSGDEQRYSAIGRRLSGMLLCSNRGAVASDRRQFRAITAGSETMTA